MAITSQIRNTLTTGETILQDWQHAGLLKPSLLKPLIATLEQNQIVKTLGQLSSTDLNGLEKSIRIILGTK
ncbi:MAG: hypothetical protein L3J24_13495 [Xanthomonadales bacterium]|nr:hypothetical protein [Xanthomonadales bacterium]